MPPVAGMGVAGLLVPEPPLKVPLLPSFGGQVRDDIAAPRVGA